jgi:hypothetical protein
MIGYDEAATRKVTHAHPGVVGTFFG